MVGGGETVERWLRTPGPGGLRLDWRWIVQQGGGDFPEAFDRVGVGEQGLVTVHGVQQEPLVALEAIGWSKEVGVTEGHFGGAEPHRGAGFFSQETGGDRAGIGKVDDDLVAPPGQGAVAVDREHPQRRLAEA